MRARMRHRLRRLLGLPPAELVDLVRAQAQLVHAQLLVWTRPVGGLVDVPTVAESWADEPSPEQQLRDQRRIALAIERAAENGVFRPQCLVRAVTLQRMLERAGIHGSRVQVGVEWVDGKFAAHAWVERGDQILGDREAHVARFAPLTDVQLTEKH